MNAANPAATDKAEQMDQIARKQETADFLALANTKQGRRFLWSLLGKCNLFSTSFNPHGGLMNIAEGKKQIGYQYLEKFNQLCPDLYALMTQEANEAVRNRQLQLDNVEEESND